jgi:hypothetical protein
VRGGDTGIPCAGGMCFHAVPNVQFEGGREGEGASPLAPNAPFVAWKIVPNPEFRHARKMVPRSAAPSAGLPSDGSAGCPRRWRIGREACRSCSFLRFHGHWCVVGLARRRAECGPGRSICVKSVWNRRDFVAKFGSIPAPVRHPPSGVPEVLAVMARGLAIRHTFVRSASRIKIRLPRRADRSSLSRIAWFESHFLPSSCRRSVQASQQGFPRLTGTALGGGQGVGVFSKM